MEKKQKIVKPNQWSNVVINDPKEIAELVETDVNEVDLNVYITKLDKKKFNIKFKWNNIIGNNLPKEGDIMELRISKSITEKLEVSKKYAEAIKLRPSDKPGEIVWNWIDDKGIDVEFSDMELAFLKKIFNEINERKKLTPDTMQLFEMFCE